MYLVSTVKPDFSSGFHFQYDVNTSLNFHETIEILYIVSGEMRFSVNNTEHLISDGDYIVMFPFEVHKTTEIIRNTSIACVSIDRTMLNMFTQIHNDYSLIKRVVKADEQSQKTKEIYSLLTQSSSLKNVNIKTALTIALFFELISQCELVPKIHLEKSMFDTIIHICTENYKDSSFNAETLSKLSGFSSRTISRFFKKVFNISFSRFISTLRLKCAINLMFNGKNITEAAIDSGFGSVRTFNRVFKNEYNYSPREHFKLADNDQK